LIRLIRLQGFEVFDTDRHGSQFPVAGDPDPFSRIQYTDAAAGFPT